MFKAILIEKEQDVQTVSLREIEDSLLPDGDVTVRVLFSSLNYKDALAITGSSPVVRSFPLIPGIDLVGTVEAGSNGSFALGQPVLLNGWGVGEKHWGGLAQKARLRGEWLIPLPNAFTPRQAMAIGTAGYTAMLCVMALQDHGVTPDAGEILVTGASGGVGGVATALLSGLGYDVVAVTGRPEETEYVKGLGAREVLDRSLFSEQGKPLGKERWAGAVDVAGGQVLANICATLRYGGVVAACGLAAGRELPATVAPFILRGVTLAGIDSVMCPRSRRLQAWMRLAAELDVGKLESATSEIGLAEVIPTAAALLRGSVRGRTVVDVNR